MARPPCPRVANRLPQFLARAGMPWGELARRTLLSPRLIAHLRRPGSNPSLAVAARVAGALGVPVERLWTLPRSHA